MKKFAILTTAMALSIVASAQDVESFQNQEMHHGKIKSYTFLNSQNNAPQILEMEETSTYTPNGTDIALVNIEDTQWIPVSYVDQEVIQNALDYELDTRNISLQTENPDVIVQFQVYDGQNPENKKYLQALEKYKQAHSTLQDHTAELNKGAVFVSIIDAKTDHPIWEGYAYDVFGKNESYGERQHDLRKAVNALMTRFDIDQRSFHS